MTTDPVMLWGFTIFNPHTFYMLLVKLVIDFVFAFIIIKGIYFRINRKSEYLFAFFIFNILIFFIASLLSDIKLQMGFAFGLFAVFSILRYRTKQIEIKEMTFLFISAILAVINSFATREVSLVDILLANIVIMTATYILEMQWLARYIESITIRYDNIKLVNYKEKEKLIEDLKIRTGLAIIDVEIIKINYLRDTADLEVFYKKPSPWQPTKR